MANVKNPLDEESSSPTELQPRIISIAIDLSILESKQFSGSAKLAYIGALIAQSQGFSPNARGFSTRVAQAIGGYPSKVSRYLRPIGPIDHDALRPIGPIDHDALRPIGPIDHDALRPIGPIDHDALRPIGPIDHDALRPIGPISPRAIKESRVRACATLPEIKIRQDKIRPILSGSSFSTQPRSLEEVQSLYPNYFSPPTDPKPEETASARARATLGIKTTTFEGLVVWFKIYDQDPSEKPCNLAKLFALVDGKYGKEAGPQVLSLMTAYLTLLHNKAKSKRRRKPQNIEYCFPYLTKVVGEWAKDGSQEEDAITELETAHKKERIASNGERRNDVHDNRPSDDGAEGETSATGDKIDWAELFKAEFTRIQNKTD